MLFLRIQRKYFYKLLIFRGVLKSKPEVFFKIKSSCSVDFCSSCIYSTFCNKNYLQLLFFIIIIANQNQISKYAKKLQNT